MSKIFKYMGETKGAILAIVLLLIVQAYCDLALPSFTSDIVDVGIEQGGIENVAPDIMRETTLENLSLLITDEQEAFLSMCYDKNDSGEMELNDYGTENIQELNNLLGMPILMMSELSGDTAMTEEQMTAMPNAGAKMPAMDMTSLDMDTIRGLVQSGAMTKEDILSFAEPAEKAITDSLGDYTDSIISQKALQFVQAEYAQMGIDTEKLQMQYLLRTGGKMLGYAVAAMLATILVGLLAARSGATIGKTLREGVFKKVVSFSNAEVDQFSTASLITRSTNDIQQVQMVITMMLRMVLYAPILGIGGIIKVSQTHTGMGWIIVVAVAAVMCLVGVLLAITLPKFKIMQILVDRLNLVSREILTGIPVIRAFSREKFEEKRFSVANEDLKKTQLFTNRVMTLMMPAMMFIMNGVTVMIVWFGGKGIDLGNLQVGDMMAFITYTMQIIMSFLMITMISIMLPRAGVAANRIDEIIKTKVTVNDKEETLDNTKDWKGEIAFHDVSFRYPNADADVLEHISFTAKPGETTAIIGSTGCGKSTLIHLIPRFYDVTAGQITLDGVDIRDLSQKKLHSMIGLVPQKGVLFSGTIGSNIKFADENTSDEKMKEAAEIAQATEFINEKAETYDSAISQGGSNVSGGQKQRLSIARAIAKAPKIFLFDDSFSALDYKTDVTLRKALSEKINDATVIIVAQRISTILHANRIIVLDDGKVAGIGTHEELLQSCEAYREIASSQLSEAELKGGH